MIDMHLPYNQLLKREPERKGRARKGGGRGGEGPWIMHNFDVSIYSKLIVLYCMWGAVMSLSSAIVDLMHY